MSLPSRIIFITSMLLCAGLCVWAALAFGGPAATTMWVLASLCGLVSAVVFLIKGPKLETLPHYRVEGARVPTFRLVRSEKGAKGEIWQLVLGDSQCELIRPDGTQATAFARKWAEMAIRLPGFVSGELLGIVTEDWSPPEYERAITPGDLLRAAKKIRHWDDRDTPYYWFAASKELIQEIEDYRGRTRALLGSEAAGPLRIKARRCILSGVIGLAAGTGLLLFGVVSLLGQDGREASSRAGPVGFGTVITLIALGRLAQGIALYRQAGQASREGGPTPL